MHDVTYSSFFSIFSVIIAIISSYTTLVLVSRILDRNRSKKRLWLLTGAIIMGSGIFSTHFIGMVAFHVDNPITYDWFLLLLAFLSSCIASYAAFYLLHVKPLTRTKILVSGLTVGVGIVLLHYIATFAIHERVEIQFTSIYFALSIFISLAFSSLAIKIFINMRENPHQPNNNIVISSIVLGLTISLLHFTGMRATKFFHINLDQTTSVIDARLLGNIFSISSIFIMLAALITAYLDHRSVEAERRLLRTLEESELRYRRLVEQSPLPILVHDGQTILLVNDSCLKVLQTTDPNNLIGKKITTFIRPETRQLLRNHTSSLGIEVEMGTSQQQIITLNQTMIDAEITWTGIIYDNKPAIQLVIRDITEQNKIKRELEEKNQRYLSLFEYYPDPVFSLDCHGFIKELNPVVWNILGYTEEELLKMSFHALVDPSYLDTAISKFELALAGNPLNYELLANEKNGNKFPANITLIPIIIDGNVTGVFCIAKDLTKEKEALQKIEELAYTDQLTGLPNRTWFYDYFKTVLGRTENSGGTVAILMLDFDNFKDVNDTLGHHVGDLYLQKVSKDLKDCLHPKDRIVRIGGDEFIILLEETTMKATTDKAKKVLSKMNQRINLNGHEISVTLSIGISINSGSSTDVDSMFRQADLAMYYAKEQGKNNYQFFTDELNERVTRKLKLKNALRRSISKQELKLYYQPLVEIQTGKVVGLEALLRWKPSFGTVSPNEFIPIAEETGVIIPIGEWVMKETCRQIKHWESQGLQIVPVSFNVSAKQFQDTDFTSKIKQIVRDANIDPSFLEIEITESVMLNIKESAKIIQELRDWGIKIAIDDFGTGYSSLHVITNLKYDTLKIDKSLIDDGIKSEHRAIIRAVFDVTKNRKRIVIEGIETKEQLDALKPFPVVGQGYYFSHPLPPEELTF